MTRVSGIVTWQPVLTDHMAWTLSELASQADVPITHVVVSAEDASRRAQGWTRTAQRFETLPRRGWRRSVAATLSSDPGVLHIFGGVFGEWRIRKAFFRALRLGRRVWLVSEPYSPRAEGYFTDVAGPGPWFRAALRPLRYRVYGLRMAGRIERVFAISPLAIRQFSAAGVPDGRIVPFGYFVPGLRGAHARPDSERPGQLRLVFVGSLIARKGLHELLAAVRGLRDEGMDLTLDVYGTGDTAAFDFAGAGAVHRGTIPFGESSATIATYDALVLPSRHDGWGVVVNEAVQAAVPVVCSAATGAGAMIRRWHCGRVYAGTAGDTLRDALAELARNRGARVTMSANALRLAPMLEPSFAARYMLETLRDDARAAPECPWYDVNE